MNKFHTDKHKLKNTQIKTYTNTHAHAHACTHIHTSLFPCHPIVPNFLSEKRRKEKGCLYPVSRYETQGTHSIEEAIKAGIPAVLRGST